MIHVCQKGKGRQNGPHLRCNAGSFNISFPLLRDLTTDNFQICMAFWVGRRCKTSKTQGNVSLLSVLVASWLCRQDDSPRFCKVGKHLGMCFSLHKVLRLYAFYFNRLGFLYAVCARLYHGYLSHVHHMWKSRKPACVIALQGWEAERSLLRAAKL